MGRNLQPGEIVLRNKCSEAIGLVDQHGTTVTIDIGKNRTPLEIEVRPSQMNRVEAAKFIKKQIGQNEFKGRVVI